MAKTPYENLIEVYPHLEYIICDREFIERCRKLSDDWCPKNYDEYDKPL
jgi:hypothetical protein